MCMMVCNFMFEKFVNDIDVVIKCIVDEVYEVVVK